MAHPSQANHKQSDNKYEEEEEEYDSEQQSTSAILRLTPTPTTPQDYSSLTFDEEELCRASITFSRYFSPSQPLSVKSNHALLVILRTPDTYDSTLYVYTSHPPAPPSSSPSPAQLWYDVVRARACAAVRSGAGRSAMHVFHCRFHDAGGGEDSGVAAAVRVRVGVRTAGQLQEECEGDAVGQPHGGVLPRTVRFVQSTTADDDDADFMMETDDKEDEDEEDDEEAEVVSAQQDSHPRLQDHSASRTMKTPTGLPSGANDKLAVGIAMSHAPSSAAAICNRRVRSTTRQGKLDFVTSIGDIKGKSGQSLKPTQMMLHEGDRKMVLLDSQRRPARCTRWISSAAKLCSEYQAHGDGTDFAVRSVGHTSKYAERTGEQTILGVNKNSVFSLDPRQNGGKLAQKHTYSSAHGHEQQSSPTERDTWLRAASKGEIRLYNDIGKVAKTRLPGLGDAIIGLDTTEDGKWSAIHTLTTRDRHHYNRVCTHQA